MLTLITSRKGPCITRKMASLTVKNKDYSLKHIRAEQTTSGVVFNTCGEAKTVDKIHMTIIGFNQERCMIGHRIALRRSNPIKTLSFILMLQSYIIWYSVLRSMFL